jgi:hypothetical protein
MGDLNAVDIAQEVHECILRRHGALVDAETIRYGEPVPAGAAWEGVYVDDHLGLLLYQPADQALTGKGVETGRGVVINELVTKAYEATPGLEEAKEKEVNYASEFTAWGTHTSRARGVLLGRLANVVQVWPVHSRS